MRKRTQYKKPSAKNKIPTLIIMCVTLFVILYFGKNISNGVADFFAPKAPVTDQAVVAVPEAVQLGDNNLADPHPLKDAPDKSGAVINQANKNAAQNILKVLSKQ